MAGTEIRADVIANDRASAAFSRVGKSAAEMGIEMDVAAREADKLDRALDRMQHKTIDVGADVNRTLKSTDKILADVEKSISAVSKAGTSGSGGGGNKKPKGLLGQIPGGGALGGIPGLGSLLSALPAAQGLLNPYTVGAGVAATPFLGTAIGGSLVGALGAGITGLGIFGALSTGQAPAAVSALQLTAASASAAAAQDRLNKLQASGKASAAQLAAAQASVASAQDKLNKLQSESKAAAAWKAQNDGALKARAAFTGLFNDAEKGLREISVPFQGVLTAIAKTADTVLPYIFKPLGAALKEIAPALQQIGETLAISFASPRIQSSIAAVAKAFTQFLAGFSGQIPGIVNALATGIESIANSFTRHPDMITGMEKVLAFLLKLPGYVASGLAALTNVTHWLLFGLPHDVSIGLDNTRKFLLNFGKNVEDDFNNVLHAIRVTWNDIYGATIGVAIRIGHDAEAQFNSLRHAVANIFDGIRQGIAVAWNLAWANTIGQVQRGISNVTGWFKGLPSRITAALGNLGALLVNGGKNVITGLWNGAKSVWGSVWNWFKGLPGNILHALGIASPPKWAIQAGEHIAEGLFGWTSSKRHEIVSRFGNLASGAAAAAAGAVGGGGSLQTLMRSLAASAYGWTGAQWNALNAVEMREAGYNMTARNPTSGAYGLAQFINGPAEYYQYGGDPNTAAGQIIAMLNYIASRYGSPAGAWQHEMSFGWYDRGGYLPPGLSLAYNGTGRPEPVGAVRSGNSYTVNVYASPLASPADTGRAAVNAILAFEKRSGKGWRA